MESNMKPPAPICKAFLTCRGITDDPRFKDKVLVGIGSHCQHHRFPASLPVGIFARVSSGHGEYQVEIQVQDRDGAVVWCDSPPSPWRMDDPIRNYDLVLTINLVFPAPGDYDLVLLLNGDEVGRERFSTSLAQPRSEKGRSF